MAKPVITVDDAGVSGASLAENVAGLNERQRGAFGNDLADTPQTPQSQWSGLSGLALTEVGEATSRAALYGASIDHSAGTGLDALGSLTDVRRIQGRHSRVVATFTGVSATNIPKGSRARTAAGDEFATDAAVVLQPGGVMVPMTAVTWALSW